MVGWHRTSCLFGPHLLIRSMLIQPTVPAMLQNRQVPWLEASWDCWQIGSSADMTDQVHKISTYINHDFLIQPALAFFFPDPWSFFIFLLSSFLSLLFLEGSRARWSLFGPQWWHGERRGTRNLCFKKWSRGSCPLVRSEVLTWNRFGND